MRNKSDTDIEYAVGKEMYAQGSVLLYDTMDRAIKKMSNSTNAHLETLFGIGVKHRKRRDAAFLRMLPEAIAMAPKRGNTNRGTLFCTLWTGSGIMPDDELVPAMIDHRAMFLGDRNAERQVMTMFILDDIFAGGAAQWDKLCDLYKEELCPTLDPEPEDDSAREDDPSNTDDEKDEFADTMRDTLYPMGFSLGYPLKLLSCVCRTIESVFPTNSSLFVHALKQKNVSDFVYDENAGSISEVKRWESLLSLMHPDTIKLCSDNFKAHAWNVWKEYCESVSSYLSKNQMEKIFTQEDREKEKYHNLDKVVGISVSCANDSATGVVGDLIASKMRLYSVFLEKWMNPCFYLPLSDEARNTSSAPWVYKRKKMGGAWIGPDQDRIKEEEAASLLFAAFLLAYCGDDFLFAQQMFCWTLDGALRKLPSFPVKVLRYRQSALNRNKDKKEEEECGEGDPDMFARRSDPWCVPEEQGEFPSFFPVFPDDKKLVEEAMLHLTRAQYVHMYNRTILPIPYYGHGIKRSGLAIDGIKGDFMFEQMPSTEPFPLPEDYLTNHAATLSSSLMQDACDKYVRYTYATMLEDAVQTPKPKASADNEPGAQEDLQQELARMRMALKQAEELIRAKNDEIKQLRDKVAEMAPEEEAKEGEPVISEEEAKAPAKTEEPMPEEPDDKDYELKKKVIVLGGTARFVQELRDKLNGDVRFIDTEEARPDLSQCLNGVVFIQANYISHRISTWATTYCKQNKVPIQYFQSTGAATCIKQIIKYDKRLTRNSKEVKEGA